MAREVDCRYVDPLSAVWLAAASRIGLGVARSREVFACTDGRGTLHIGDDDQLDADDCLAQMIFHELCHSLVEGVESFGVEDWGLDNQHERDLPREQACLRLQALLAAPHGLREVLAPTTDHRRFYDALPDDPLAPRDDPTVVMARAGAARAERAPWAPHLAEALTATEAMARGAQALTELRGRPTLWTRLAPAPPHHPLGFPLAADGEARCGGCAWLHRGGRGRPVTRCRQAQGARVETAWRACVRWEPALDCGACGACCREAYGELHLGPRDPFVERYPELIRREGRRRILARDDGRCAALSGDGTSASPYRCREHEHRPRTCRDFERGGEHCLTARRRVGLSR